MAFKKLSALILTMQAIVSIAIAQPTLQKLQQKLVLAKLNTAKSFYRFEINSKIKNQASLLFSADMAIPKSNLQTWLANVLDLRKGTDIFKEKAKATDYQGTQITKLQQYFKGIKVEHGIISEVDLNGQARLLQMEFYSINDDVAIKPVITEVGALQIAKAFVGASTFAWEHNENKNPDWAMPQGELVIVEDVISNPGTLCLAYKYNIYALHPESRQLVYVNAINGKVVFRDYLIKNCHIKTAKNQPETIRTNVLKQHKASHFSKPIQSYFRFPMQNFDGALDTRYSGTRGVKTTKDNFGAYRLSADAIGNNTNIEILNSLNQPDIMLASGFTDADNVWSTAEFPNNINMALDAYWGLQRSAEYWWQIHGRKSYDNNNGALRGYVFYRSDFNELFDNASWNGNFLRMGEGGFPPDNHKPWTSIDIIGHEIGHAVCQFTADLVYARESGALNEGFSDIWGACLKNFVKNELAGDLLTKQQWQIGEDISYTSQGMLRSLENPLLKQDPDTYLDKANKWINATVEGCTVPATGTGGNDNCGVHTNSGVLNKWFYLISNGGTGSNGNFFSYTVDPMGIDKAQHIAYFTEQILTPNAGFEAARIASLNAVILLASSPNTLGITEADTGNIKKAWKAVGVINDTVFNRMNTPVFLSDTFTCVGVGKYGNIWAGTINKGIYRYDGKEWKQAPSLTDHNISDIKSDINGRVWVAQYGRSGFQALGGGLSCYYNSDFASYRYYTSDSGMPSRNVRSLYINNRLVFDTFKRVWAAVFADNTNAGSLVRGSTNQTLLDFNYKPFKKIGAGLNPANGFCSVVGGNDEEVWVYAATNGAGGINQILRYKISDSSYLGAIDQTNSILPAGFNVKAIYADIIGKKWWVGITSGGLYVYTIATTSWQNINPPAIFPAGTIINNNAITGDADGNIFIGTNKGYVKFGGENSGATLDPTNIALYRRYTVDDGLPSDIVRGIAVDNRASRLILATDKGMAFRYNLCKECINTQPFYTIGAGNWNDPAIWLDGKIPRLNSIVIINNQVVVNQNVSVKTIYVNKPGSILINPGVQLQSLGGFKETN